MSSDHEQYFESNTSVAVVSKTQTTATKHRQVKKMCTQNFSTVLDDYIQSTYIMHINVHFIRKL